MMHTMRNLDELERAHPIPQAQAPQSQQPNGVVRFLGGSPLWVAVRLALASILVGVIMAAFGLDPWDIVHSLERLVRSVWNMGFEAFEAIWRYFLLGAVLVIPIWLIARILRAAPKGRA